jgi:SAM-dependent methyltransferase
MMDADHQQRPGPTGYDAELRRHNEVLRRACGIQFRDHVLDIGCGAGQTTRQAARTARAGSALGVDVSAPAIEGARELARAEELRNSPSSAPTRKSTGSRTSASTWRSAGSARCSSTTPPPRSPTSGGRCGRAGDWS